MIILNLKDGLGNQMFEYGFAKYLQKKTGDKIIINNFFFDGKKRKKYSLYHFMLNSDIKVVGKPSQIYYTICFVCRLFVSYKLDFIKWLISHKRPKGDEIFLKASEQGMYVNFESFHDFEIKPAKCRVKYIYGNYEHRKYIEDVIEELQEEFKIISKPSDKNKKMIEELDNCEAVCVHIRRGDYLSPQWKTLNVCTFEYYQNAMDVVQTKSASAKFYIFSNTHEDIEWIQKNYHFKQAVNYVDLDNCDYEELRLMIHCKHFVISNSTFSWWAAVLAKSENKIVTVPEKWIMNEQDEECKKGLYMPEWIQISI